MKEKTLTKEEVKESLEKILHFENDADLEFTAKKLLEGNSVVLDALSYMGNGKWVKRESKKRYKYKMIVPIVDDDNTLYSTDLFGGDIKNAIGGKYAIYRATRQKAINVVAIVDTNYSMDRFEFGYTDGSYGIYKLNITN